MLVLLPVIIIISGSAQDELGEMEEEEDFRKERVQKRIMGSGGKKKREDEDYDNV